MSGIAAAGVVKRYGGITALAGADFAAARGEVHGLLGENGAGKSTFIQVLAGSVRHDAGAILLDGVPFRPRRPEEAQRLGISAVFQELSLVPDLTVAENVWFRREPLNALGMIRRRAMRRNTEVLFRRYGFPPLQADQEVRRLTLADRQLVEVAKALARDPSVLILDEATSALAPREADWLLGLARELAAAGKLVVFISHRMDEIRRVADRITVFRNGATVATHSTADVDDGTIVTEMLGRRLDRLYPQRVASATGRVALGARGLSVGTRLKDVDLDLMEGEVLGVGGLQNQGQRELFQGLYGAVRTRGTISVNGAPARLASPRRALANGLAFVPEDRRHQGLLLSKSVRENLTLAIAERIAKRGFVDRRREDAACRAMIERLAIKVQSPEQAAGTLSGGNQQKVVFGKMLLTEARILLLFDPTRGVDVGTKGEIFQLMRDLAREGYAILFHSSDLAELAHVADRVAVLHGGRLAATLSGDRLTEGDILRAGLFGAGGAPS